jgi:signal transduction histidine kinase
MQGFLANNRHELIARCKVKVSQRPQRAATEAQLRNGLPLFLEQLQRTLAAEEGGQTAESMRISGSSGGDAHDLSEMGVSAAAHGRQLWELGFTVDQVVHDYGDLCQAITDLAVERDAPFSINEFRTLNRCLDNAIASAVTEFSAQRNEILARRQIAEANERLGFIVHELRNALGTVVLAVKALETGSLPISGATGHVLKRGHSALHALIEQMIAEVREQVGAPVDGTPFSLAAFISDAQESALLQAREHGCPFEVSPVDPDLAIAGDRERLLGALANLLQNAFKFTHRHTVVGLTAHAIGDRVRIEVSDHCGGLPPGALERIFTPFSQRHDDRTGLGLGLSIARNNVEADGGTLEVLDRAGTGCVFTIDLPRRALQ